MHKGPPGLTFPSLYNRMTLLTGSLHPRAFSPFHPSSSAYVPQEEMFKSKGSPPAASPLASAEGTSDAAIFLRSLKDPSIIERVRVSLKNAHVFKLPPRQTASVGYRGADWRDKVWQGTVKVVERGDTTAILLVDKEKGSIFAVCPVTEGAVERCTDSSRYFVLRIENANGAHVFIGVAFNERNDAFDFNAALEDSKREKEMEKMPLPTYTGPTKDYSIKEGQKIHVAIPKSSPSDDENRSQRNRAGGRGRSGGGLLKPSSKDTPRRANDDVNDGFGTPFFQN